MYSQQEPHHSTKKTYDYGHRRAVLRCTLTAGNADSHTANIARRGRCRRCGGAMDGAPRFGCTPPRRQCMDIPAALGRQLAHAAAQFAYRHGAPLRRMDHATHTRPYTRTEAYATPATVLARTPPTSTFLPTKSVPPSTPTSTSSKDCIFKASISSHTRRHRTLQKKQKHSLARSRTMQ